MARYSPTKTYGVWCKTCKTQTLHRAKKGLIGGLPQCSFCGTKNNPFSRENLIKGR